MTVEEKVFYTEKKEVLDSEVLKRIGFKYEGASTLGIEKSGYYLVIKADDKEFEKEQIKEALNDEHLQVRLTAAHLLGTMNDKSGLERMQLDFMKLVPGNGASEPSDPNITTDPKELEKWNRNRLYRISKSLEVAEVLAELGDRRGYELACKVGLNESLAAIRSRAVNVLGEIAKTKPAILAAEGKDPVLALSQRAKVEKRITVFKKIVMVAKELRGEKGLQILEQARRSPHQEPKDIERVKGYLEKIRKEIKSSPK